jgi:periplasmic mercuric ion binding protein
MFFRFSTDPELVMSKLLASFVLTALIAAPVWAAPQTVTLAVPGMTCAACPITVKQALSKVDGVTKTEVVFEKREAIVTFDNAKTTLKALTDATTNAGYPSTVKN